MAPHARAPRRRRSSTRSAPLRAQPRAPVVAGSNDVARLVPLVADKVAVGGEPTAYVCERRVCALPTTDPAVFARQIARVRPLPPDASAADGS